LLLDTADRAAQVALRLFMAAQVEVMLETVAATVAKEDPGLAKALTNMVQAAVVLADTPAPVAKAAAIRIHFLGEHMGFQQILMVPVAVVAEDQHLVVETAASAVAVAELVFRDKGQMDQPVEELCHLILQLIALWEVLGGLVAAPVLLELINFQAAAPK
jgi:hypothetical protein